MLFNNAIIIGSGNSLCSGLERGLIDYIEKYPSFGINDAVRFFNCTAYTFGDWTAYASRYDLYKTKNLVIGRYDTHIGNKIEGAIPCPKQPDLILLQGSGKYNGDEGLSKGLYSSVLTGAFTLNLACRLGFKKIFLCGFDCCEINNRTHFYQDTPNAGQYIDYEGKPTTGVGFNEDGTYKTSFYNKDDKRINELWEPFLQETKSQIFNVSPESKISVFPKITYREMFKQLDSENSINQLDVEIIIKEKLEPFNKA